MKIKTIRALMILMAFLPAMLPAMPTTFRTWGTGSLTFMFSPRIGLTMMTGLRYELSRTDNSQSLPAKGLYFTEGMVGPFYAIKLGSITVKLPVYYYYMGFPTRESSDYYYSHNANLAPAVEYRSNKFSIIGRAILLNTFYASVYEMSNERRGYSMLIRAMMQAGFSVNKKMNLFFSDEPFIGLVADPEASANPAGFASRGLSMNRINLGVERKIRPYLFVVPQYVFETAYDANHKVVAVNHNVLLNLNFILKMF